MYPQDIPLRVHAKLRLLTRDMRPWLLFPPFPILSPLVSVSYLGAQILGSHEEASQHRASMYLLEVLWPPPLTSSPALPLSCLTGGCSSLGASWC